MEIRWVQNIIWSGTELSTYALLMDYGLRTVSIVPAPSLFLLSEAQRGILEHSLRAIAEDLKSLFDYFLRMSMDWRDVTDGEMSSYIHFHLIREKELKDNSIARHISSIKGFYMFGWVSGFLGAPKSFTFYYKRDESKQYRSETRKINFNLKNQYLDRVLFEEVLSGVVARSDLIRERNELALELGFRAGLRTSEVTDNRNLITSDLSLLISEAEKVGENTIKVKIFGKRNKLRSVDFSPSLTKKIKYFMDGRRKNIKDGPLICSTHGDALRESFATDVFRSAKRCVQHRMPSLLESLGANTRNHYYVSTSAFNDLTFHCLRHTYATNLVDFCYKNGFDPWEYVPEQMGHEDEDTTKEYIVFDGLIYRREKVRRALEDEDT
jgi:site-specific recombinase XerD